VLLFTVSKVETAAANSQLTAGARDSLIKNDGSVAGSGRRGSRELATQVLLQRRKALRDHSNGSYPELQVSPSPAKALSCFD
jgi:hypothetical protein